MSTGWSGVETQLAAIVNSLNSLQPQGVVSATLYDGGGGVYNVMHPDFGAIGDGVADDTLAIQAAINVAQVQAGAVYIPHGTFVVTGLSISGDHTLFFGPGTIAGTTSTSNNTLAVSGDYVTVRDCRFVGNYGQASTSHAIIISGEGVQVFNTHISDAGKSGIAFTTGGNNGRVMGNYINRSGISAILATNGSGGCLIHGNYVEQSNLANSVGHGGICVQGTYLGGRDFSITGNFVFNAVQTAIRVGSVSGYAPKQVTVANNIINTTTGSSSSECIVCEMDGGSVVGNVIDNPNVTAILVYGKAKNIAVVGNLIRNASITGAGTHVAIQLMAGPAQTVENITVVGNVAVDDQGTPTMSGLLNLDTSTHGTGTIQGVTVAGNSSFGTISGFAGFTPSSLALVPRFAANSVDGEAYNQTTRVLDDSGSPTVRNSSIVETGGTTTITDFDDGIVNQTITVYAKHTVTITNGTPIKLAGATNFTMTAGDTLTLTMFVDQIWSEVARSVN